MTVFEWVQSCEATAFMSRATLFFLFVFRENKNNKNETKVVSNILSLLSRLHLSLSTLSRSLGAMQT